ncbi:hypothetical protein [Tritonibacter mobilis]|uniref:hypothetical protein n=1 Tax=Tritonibacter mobilis TaxID=379347 RepID=UPI001CD9D938|nr:hypothetical protein [Tritonibacter mobilis]MCA2008025.1 hypothetical protein [Tritonibacter mobilis]
MRSYHRKKLNKLLAAAGNEEFIQLLWATHALQSGCADAARKFIRPETIPDGAITTDMRSEHFIHKWKIETLANELMTVPKAKPGKKGATRTLLCDHYGASINCANRLHDLENAESKNHKNAEEFLVEMGRIAARQFDWQRGYVNIPQFYRNAYVYGQGKCAAYFECKHGISFNRFSQIGFLLYALFRTSPVMVQEDTQWAKFGVTLDEVERVLALISLPFSEAAKLAQTKRRKIIHTADKPSVLRQAPCLRFGNHGERIRAPLPELILERVTSGVFYDVVDGGDDIRNDYGRNFEKYCFNYLSDTLPGFVWDQESRYGTKQYPIDTPDILCSEEGKLTIVFECKATRMSHEAKFGKDPMAARGYVDLVKGVFQLWRFFSHCRRGCVGRDVTDAAVGVVLTLDNWLILAETLRKRVLEDAAKMAGEKDPEITEADRRPIVFVGARELERTLSSATKKTFKESLFQANSEKYQGWQLGDIHRQLFNNNEREKLKYPYADKLSEFLPWYDEFQPRDK